MSKGTYDESSYSNTSTEYYLKQTCLAQERKIANLERQVETFRTENSLLRDECNKKRMDIKELESKNKNLEKLNKEIKSQNKDLQHFEKIGNALEEAKKKPSEDLSKEGIQLVIFDKEATILELKEKLKEKSMKDWRNFSLNTEKGQTIKAAFFVGAEAGGDLSVESEHNNKSSGTLRRK